MEELLEYLRETKKDGIFSRIERKIIKQKLGNKEWDAKNIGILRSKIFDMAKASEKLDAQTIDWLEEAVKVVFDVFENPEIEETAYFSTHERLREEVIHEIEMAQQYIDVCVFTISDNYISEALIAKKKEGVRVRIITDNDKMYDKGSDIKWLASERIGIKMDNRDAHMHHKFAIFDRKRLLNGSFNWTRSATERNQENFLITTSLKLVNEYEDQFDYLWETLEDYRK